MRVRCDQAKSLYRRPVFARRGIVRYVRPTPRVIKCGTDFEVPRESHSTAALRSLPTFMPQLKIREMPQDERPREKLLARGVDALSNAELIAILLRTGRRGMNVVDVARELFDKYKSFAELSRCSVKELSEIKGIGPAKALVLAAAFNLGN